MSVRVVAAPWVLPGCAGSGAPCSADGAGAAAAIRDGAVALDGDRVVAVGPRAEVEARHGGAERLDAVILPALVNAHLHLELSHMAGRIAGGEGLPAWIHLFVSARAGGVNEVAVTHAMTMGAEDLLRYGVAAVGDVTNTLASLAPLAAAGLAGTLFHEVFGVTPERLERSVEAADAARAAAGAPPPGLRICRSPHAIYSTAPAALAGLLDAGPGSLHLAEDPAERALCARGEGGFARMYEAFGARAEGLRPVARSPVAAVAEHLRPHHLVVHAVDLDDEDVGLLARAGATVVLCPRSNQFIVGRLPRLEALLAAGIPLAVGTDSLASCPTLSPLADLAVLAREVPAVPPARLLPLAWNGAAVGAPHVGRLAPGACPGVLAAPLHGRAADDPFAFLLSAFGRGEEPFTWLARQAPPSTLPRSPDA